MPKRPTPRSEASRAREKRTVRSARVASGQPPLQYGQARASRTVYDEAGQVLDEM